MLRLIANWVLSAIALLLVEYIVPGFYLSGIGPALIAAVVIGLINSTLGLFLKVVTFPLSILTLGIFWWVINALMIKLASMLVPGFHINGFAPAFFAAILLSILNMVFRWLVRRPEEAR